MVSAVVAYGGWEGQGIGEGEGVGEGRGGGREGEGRGWGGEGGGQWRGRGGAGEGEGEGQCRGDDIDPPSISCHIEGGSMSSPPPSPMKSLQSRPVLNWTLHVLPYVNLHCIHCCMYSGTSERTH